MPEYETDFFFSAIGEECGLVGIFILLSRWGVIFWRLYGIWRGSANNFTRLMVGGVFVLLLAHFFVNIGTNVAILPVTGISLPFVSYGGSNLLSVALALGLVLGAQVRSNAPEGLMEHTWAEIEEVFGGVFMNGSTS